MAPLGRIALLPTLVFALTTPTTEFGARQRPARPLPAGPPLAQWILGAVGPALASVALLLPAASFGENELAALGAKGFDSSLIDTECFATRCALPAKSCLESNDCRKGMTCTAKCLGDNACITGCFAKYGNAEMSDLLECSVEREGCIKIAILEGGADTKEAAPAPPAPLVANFDPQTLDGTWYKVMGWNSRYDCFDCQRNTFAAERADNALLGRSSRNFDVDVEFSMPRPPRGLFETAATSYPLRVVERLVFDDAGKRPHDHPQVMSRFSQRANAADAVAADAPARRRHASTEGHMFGLTFWENWSILGENAKGEAPFKFVYYTGRTTQNTYDGAFVYAREPQLPVAAKPAVYAIARRAGLQPEKFCLVKNDCATCSSTFAKADAARAATDPEREAKDRARSRGLFMGAATAAEAQFLPDDESGADVVASAKKDPLLPAWLDDALTDVGDYLENPHATARWLFNQQVKNTNL
ncbi:hypothetical protein M885DRAFT_545620 [Pelagophyceae sp. CCMP2097]|nr:hypothetical protein M885DRAFT_545620 [Pelagophyceae sp. CCMP2097]|mmetsp:Transcript_15151/g.52728  ORF Transcript_15151/g.52728 Transcript_15151/m.52728 type:complete len:473 (+) Transcript_15151:65-1483(+)|eukprot:CAMPEP_0184082806 /NCGR_PEP_ID=MMETSP0974-20121125/3390_1 /TAXON_ID=483370 /ORGANISM="non described non described, Strain CCMP2097" /LENGTH=472 /DNA_ID=CAMNT_0026385481 /DNA_START=57 /DNA_END=1475 /DNA_ORIENTATION=-